MKKTLTLLMISSALAGALALPALAAAHAGIAVPGACPTGICANEVGNAANESLFILASNDDGGDDNDSHDSDSHDSDHGSSGHNDSSDNDSNDDGDSNRNDSDDDADNGNGDDDCNNNSSGDCDTGNAAAARKGPIVPPANGLFGNGAPPVVVTK